MNVASWQILAGSVTLWFWALLVPIYLFAQLRGDATARASAGALLTSVLLGTLLSETSTQAAVGPIGFALDFGLLVALFAICLRSKWLYPIWIAAAQLLAVLIGAIALAGLGGTAATRSMLLPSCTVVQLGAFAYGLIAHRNRRPLWQVKRRPENASSDLAPRAKSAR